MRPHLVPSPADDESDLFRNRLDSLIDMRHEFVRLSGLIDWRFAPKWDLYLGTAYIELNGGLDSGYLSHGNWQTTAGLRFRW